MTLLKRSRIEEDHQNGSSVHFIETSPSVLREVPWITYREYKVHILVNIVNKKFPHLFIIQIYSRRIVLSYHLKKLVVCVGD